MDDNAALRSPQFIGLTLFLLFSFASLNGQTQTTQTLSPDKIRLILLQGNEKTRDEIILREMKLRQGDKLDLEELQRDELRIQNLGIFNRVEIDVVPTNEGAILVVSVSEMWYIYPYPIIFRNERLHAVRDAVWKLRIRQTDPAQPATPELYNLSIDPYERFNVAEGHPDVVERLETFSTNCGKPSIHFYGHTHGYSRGQSRDHQHLMVNVSSAGGALDRWGEQPQADYPEFSVSQDTYGFVIVDVEAGDDAALVDQAGELR